MSQHKQWLDNEYSLWVKALQESTVHNFKEHPQVQRMLSQTDGKFFTTEVTEAINNVPNIYKIDQIGYNALNYFGIDSRCGRYVYYALEILKRNPSSICEIGGGVGQFMAILTALGYNGQHFMLDLPEVLKFQEEYLLEVRKVTALNTFLMTTDWKECDFVCSFYALGEFDDETKESYREILNNAKHGYIAFNPHSGATDDLSLFKHDIKVTDGIEPNIKIITW